MTLPLRERVEALAGGDREVDALIMCALAAPAGSFVEQSKFNGEWSIYSGQTMRGAPRLWDWRGIWYRPEGWPLTSSLDATVALVERVAPDKCWSITKNWWPEGHEKARAEAFAADLYPGTSDITGPTAPLALLAALLRSLEADAGDNHGS